MSDLIICRSCHRFSYDSFIDHVEGCFDVGTTFEPYVESCRARLQPIDDLRIGSEDIRMALRSLGPPGAKDEAYVYAAANMAAESLKVSGRLLGKAEVTGTWAEPSRTGPETPPAAANTGERPSRKDMARYRLEVAGRHWHSVMGHPISYDACPNPTCYHTHSMVAK